MLQVRCVRRYLLTPLWHGCGLYADIAGWQGCVIVAVAALLLQADTVSCGRHRVLLLTSLRRICGYHIAIAAWHRYVMVAVATPLLLLLIAGIAVS